MKEKKKQIAEAIEAERERLLGQAYQLNCPFLQAFFAQCVESTAADAHEIFLETQLSHNYFRENLYRLKEEQISRFYKLAAMHHSVRMVRRRKKEVRWEEVRQGLLAVYAPVEWEMHLLEHLKDCCCFYQGGFSEIFCKITARYLFGDRVLHGFSFAFIGNFWYNSYSSFMGSFTGYVPFHIRRQKAL